MRAPAARREAAAIAKTFRSREILIERTG